MADEFVATLATKKQIRDLFTGPFLKGRSEPRVAMVGRSNVGKSSLINTLMGARHAQTSNQPGKTRAIHFYFWKQERKIFADLPGYGYARSSHEDKDRWAEFINAYLKSDEALERALVLLDARHGPTDLDREAIRFLSFESVPVNFVFTKWDQLKTQSERARRKKEGQAALAALGYDPELAVWVSSKTKDGLKDLIALINGQSAPTGWKRK